MVAVANNIIIITSIIIIIVVIIGKPTLSSLTWTMSNLSICWLQRCSSVGVDVDVDVMFVNRLLCNCRCVATGFLLLLPSLAGLPLPSLLLFLPLRRRCVVCAPVLRSYFMLIVRGLLFMLANITQTHTHIHVYRRYILHTSHRFG